LIHLVLHAAVPGVVAWFFFRKQWRSAWLIMLAARTRLIGLGLVSHMALDLSDCGVQRLAA